jgi:hypothetical protein
MKRTAMIATFFLCLGIAGAQFTNVIPGTSGVDLYLTDTTIKIRDGRREVVITSAQLIDLLSERFPVTTYPADKTITIRNGTSQGMLTCITNAGTSCE